MKRYAPIVAIVLPLLVFAYWVMQQDQHVRHGTTVRLAVQGYDPRDLLAGHYLRYTVNYGTSLNCHPDEKKDCICLSPDANGISQATWNGECAQMPTDGTCNLWLKGQCSWNRFEAGIERYYFPEKFSDVLQQIPPNATIEVSLDGAGAGIVTGFFVDGTPLMNWVRKPTTVP